jgi:hypothetical protein
MAHRFQIPPSAKLVDPTSWSLVLDGYGLLGIRILGEVDDTPHMLDERELYFNLRKEITSMGVARVLKFEKETSTLNSIALAQSWSDDLAKKLSLELGSNLGSLGLDFSGVVESSWNRLERFEVVVNELTTVTEKFEEEVTIAESQNDHLLLFDQYRRVRADVRFRSIEVLLLDYRSGRRVIRTQVGTADIGQPLKQSLSVRIFPCGASPAFGCCVD